jgi:hypothetical protein
MCFNLLFFAGNCRQPRDKWSDGMIVRVLCGGGIVPADFVVVLLMRSLLGRPWVNLIYKKL